MAEEDLIFGKNRHFFGGIEPSNMKSFTVLQKGNQVVIRAVLPNDTIINDQTLCTVSGAVIRRKLGSYPTDEFDGDEVMTITESGEYVDSTVVLSGSDIYYAAFPFSSQGVYNRNSKNRCMFIDGSTHYLFGYDLDLNDPDPDTRVSYPEDVQNSNFNPVRLSNNKTQSGTTICMYFLDYGDWPSTAGEKFMPKPCLLNLDGTVKYYLDPNDYNKQEDGVTNSNINGSFSDLLANAMMEWPKIYTYREEVNGVYKFRCSDIKISDDWDCWCNYDKNDNEIDHFYTSIYYTYGVIYNNNNYNVSLSGKRSSDPSESITTTFLKAKQNGDDWTVGVLSDHLLIQDLLVMMAKSTDCQEKYGYGYYDNSSSASSREKTNGYANTYGLFAGSNTASSSPTTWNEPTKIFGMECYWGYYNRCLAGWVLDCGINKVKITRGQHDGSSTKEYNSNGDGYLEPYPTPISESGYIIKMKTEPYGRIPIVSGSSGSSSTYECDYINFSSVTDNAIASIGGSCYGLSSDQYQNGPFYSFHNTSVSSYSTLSCKPSVKGES